MPLTRADLDDALDRLLDAARQQGFTTVDLRPEDLLHVLRRATSPRGAPTVGERLRLCSRAMLGALQPGDRVMRQPGGTADAAIVIRYRLPRP